MKQALLSILLISLFLPGVLFSQQEELPTKNAVFVELGGNGLFASINYERFLQNKFGIRAGFGSLAVQGKSYVVMLNKYFGDEKKLEIGGGIVSYSHMEDVSYFGDETGTLITGTIGHNFYRTYGGLLLRYSFTPAYNISYGKFILYFGLSAGIAF